MRLRVVCGLSETIETLCPRMRLSSVDLPAFGRPTRATMPKRGLSAMSALRSWIGSGAECRMQNAECRMIAVNSAFCILHSSSASSSLPFHSGSCATRTR